MIQAPPRDWIAEVMRHPGRRGGAARRAALQADNADRAADVLAGLPDLTTALANAMPELRRRVFDAFRLSVSLDRNAGQIRPKALVSSAFGEAGDLDGMVANGEIAGAGFEHQPATGYRFVEVRTTT